MLQFSDVMICVIRLALNSSQTSSLPVANWQRQWQNTWLFLFNKLS